MDIVAEFFPYKSEEDVLALKDALDKDHPKKKGTVNWQVRMADLHLYTMHAHVE